MDPVSVKKKMVALQEKILKCNEAYYKSAQPLMSDWAYDKLINELKDFEAKYPQFKDPNSPTQHVGVDSQRGFKEVKHSSPMMSLDNSYDSADIKTFMNNVLHTCYAKNVDYLIEMKIDGLSISCRYKNGSLVQALTRGNGTTGDDVTANVLNIPDVPKRIVFPCKTPDVFEIRGEIFMSKKDFDKVNEKREAKNLPLLANPRNAAAGTLKSLDPRVVKERPLKAVFYALGEVVGDVKIETQEAMFDFFNTCDIPYIPYYYKAHTFEEVVDAIAEIDIKRHDLDVPTDGAVVKVDRFDQRLLLGTTSKYPRWAKAYKFTPNQVDTELLGITVQVGRTGVLTPVAELKPVHLDGSVIKRATLHNEDFIKNMDIRIGDVVTIEKAGEIIPAVLFSVQHKKDAEPFNFYEHLHGRCPICGESIKREIGEAAWRCTNPHCKAKLEQMIVHLSEKNALNIPIGDSVAKSIVDTGKVNNILDLFKLPSVDLVTLVSENGYMLGNNGLKIYHAIQAANDLPLSNWLYALGIPGVGKTMASHLGRVYDNLKDFYENYGDKEPIENTTEAGIKLFIRGDYGSALIKGFLDLGVNPIGEKAISKKLEGKKFVITGTLTTMDRHAAEETVRNAGGEVQGVVNNLTSFVVQGENGGKLSSKAKKAQSLHIPVITEEEFLALVR